MSNSKEINNQLENIYTDLSSLQGSQINAVTKQTELIDIVESENSRLLSKEATIDQAARNQNQIIYSNDNQRKVTSAYLTIVITIAITLGMLLLVRIIFYHFGEYIPNMVFNILIITIISLGIIISVRYYLSIRARDPYNFDELRLSAPSISTPLSTPSSGEYGFGSYFGCVGSQCCTPATNDTPGTQWNQSLGRCVFSPAGSDVTTATTVPSTPTLPGTILSPNVTNSISSSMVTSDIPANEAFENGYAVL